MVFIVANPCDNVCGKPADAAIAQKMLASIGRIQGDSLLYNCWDKVVLRRVYRWNKLPQVRPRPAILSISTTKN